MTKKNQTSIEVYDPPVAGGDDSTDGRCGRCGADCRGAELVAHVCTARLPKDAEIVIVP